ncbi:MAG: DUF1727 domain-containing protein [Thermoleophilia bacterium]|nr:DUF1727 domain-containing protein [Thermoleophilia bacterium]
MRHALAVPIARAAGTLSRRLGRGGGTALPGKVVLRLSPRAVEHLGAGLRGGTVCVSATNGKTTTCRLLAAALTCDGSALVANPAGANLMSGVAAALMAGRRGRPRPDRALFEVDEAALPEVVRQLRPHALVLMNLFRDQLDRYGELETVAAAWRRMVDDLPPQTTLVLNADDPAVADLGRRRSSVVYFGVDDPTVATREVSHASDSTRCLVCAQPLEYARVTLGHMGAWRCPSCGDARPAPTVRATRVSIDSTRGQSIEWATPRGTASATLTLPGVHNAYNATAALAAALTLGVAPAAAATAMGRAGAAFGRGERIRVHGRDLVMLLAKNPAGANTTVRTLLGDRDPLHLLVALNDRTADGQDVSWIWDVDYEPLLDHIDVLTVTGDRAHDMALRFVYAGLPRERVRVVENPSRALDAALAGVPDDRPLYVLPTYTAMLSLRAELVRRGVAREFWRDA